jgi:uncharacterized membrane protein
LGSSVFRIVDDIIQTCLFPHSHKALIIGSMPDMPVVILALTYWLHLIATVVWIGGLAMLTLIAWPGMGASFAEALDALERRFRPWANISLAVLLVTGLIQMGGDEHYDGFLIVNSAWTVGLLVKHVLIGLMIAISLVLQGSVYPALSRARLLASKGASSDEAALRRRLRQLTAVNLSLGILVLLLTAVITAL